MKTVVAYIRVSTDNQDEYSPDAQIRLIKEYAQNNNMILTNIYQDIGISGTKARKRPQFQEMIAHAKEKEFDAILVWKYSRFARNQEESIVYKSMLKKKGVEVISVSEPMPNDVYGGLIERIIEWMDEYYSIRLSEEVKRGMTQRAMQGQYNGCAPLGYDIKDGKMVINEEESKIVKYIFNSYAIEKISLLEIAKYVNQMGYRTQRGNNFENRTIKYILQNVAYIGNTRWSKNNKKNYRIRQDDNKNNEDIIYVENTHEPIITKEVFDLAQQRLNMNHRKAYVRSAPTVNWVSGLVKCSNCGSSLVASGKANFLQCGKYSKGVCTVSHCIKVDILKESIISQIKELTSTKNIEYSIVDSDYNNESELEDLEKAINSLKTKEKRIKDAYINEIDTLDEYKANKEILNKEKEELLKKYDELKNNSNDNKDDDKMHKNITSVYNALISDNTSETEKKEAINSICDKIIYNKKEKALDMYIYLNKSPK